MNKKSRETEMFLKSKGGGGEGEIRMWVLNLGMGNKVINILEFEFKKNKI